MESLPNYAIVANQSGLFIGKVEAAGLIAVTLLEPMAVIMQVDKRNGSMHMSLQPLLIPCKRVSLPSPSMVWEQADLADAFRDKVIKEYEAFQVQKRSGIQLVQGH
jgi:hypothetical protein